MNVERRFMMAPNNLNAIPSLPLDHLYYSQQQHKVSMISTGQSPERYDQSSTEMEQRTQTMQVMSPDMSKVTEANESYASNEPSAFVDNNEGDMELEENK